MNPYSSDKFVKIYYGDCKKIIPLLDISSVDLVYTDPPYGINLMHDGNTVGGSHSAKCRKYPTMKGDAKDFDPRFLLDIGKNQIIWGANYYSHLLPPKKQWIVWDKKKKNNWFDNFSDIELAWTSFEGPDRCFRYLWMGMLREKYSEERYHPTQKPIALSLWILKNWARKTDLIFDPYMGSGSALIAAKKLGMKAIGIDLEESHCEKCAKKIEKVRQGKNLLDF